MKRLVFVLPGLLIGFLLGRVGPAREKVQLQEELVQAEKRAEDAERRSRDTPQPFLLPGMGEMLQAPKASGPTAQDPGVDPSPAPDGPSEDRLGDTGGPPPDQRPPTPEEIQENFELAVEAQRLRATQSRAALIEQADLAPEQIEAVDQAIDRMNQELGLMGEDVYNMAMSGNEPDPTELLGLSHDVTGILYEAQLGLEDAVGQDALLDVEPEAAQVWNYVDLETFRDTIEGLQ